MSLLVVGVGNVWRGDDGAGPAVAARVAALGLPGVQVVVQDEPLALVEHLTAHEHVVVVDAVRPSGSPGRVHAWTVGNDPLPRSAAVGSHGLGVEHAVELARALGGFPVEVTLIGIEGERFAAGTTLSPAVCDGLERAVAAVLAVAPPLR